MRILAAVLVLAACGGGGGGDDAGDDDDPDASVVPYARAAVSGVLFEDDTSPDNISLDIGDAYADPVVYAPPSEATVYCTLAMPAGGVTLGVDLNNGNRTIFAFDAVYIPDGGAGTSSLFVVNPRNGVEMTTDSSMLCSYTIDPDREPSESPGSLRVDIACERVFSDEFNIEFRVEATLDVEGCATTP
jgi:hypothetical protein